MKKKFLASLMAIALVLPANASAATEAGISYSENQVCSDGECTNTVVLTLEHISGDDITINSSTSITIDVSAAIGVSFDSATGSGDIDLTKSSNKVTGTYGSGMDELVLEAGDELEIGTFVFTYDSDIEDCSISFDTTWGSTSITVDTNNTQTGVNMPVVAIGAAGVLAVGAYVIIKRKNKLFNI